MKQVQGTRVSNSETGEEEGRREEGRDGGEESGQVLRDGQEGESARSI